MAAGIAGLIAGVDSVPETGSRDTGMPDAKQIRLLSTAVPFGAGGGRGRGGPGGGRGRFRPHGRRGGGRVSIKNLLTQCHTQGATLPKQVRKPLRLFS